MEIKYKQALVALMMTCSGAFAQDSQNFLTADFDSSAFDFSKITKNFDFGFDFKYQDSDNPVRIPTPVEGRSTTFQLETGGPIALSDSLFILPAFTFKRKTFAENLIRNNLERNTYQTGIGLTYFLPANFEIGGDASYQLVDGRQVDPRSPQAGGADDKYSLNSFNFYTRKNWNYFELGAFVKVSGKDARTRSFTELGALTRAYDDSYDSLSYGAAGNIELFNRAIKLEANYNFENKDFEDRRARFSDGALDNTQSVNPTRDIDTQNIVLKSIVKALGAKLTLQTAFSNQNDRVFDAEDSTKIAYGVTAGYTLLGNIELEAEYTRSSEEFENFRSVWLDQTQQAALRLDDVENLKLSAKVKATDQITFGLKYEDTVTDSNYADDLGNLLQAFDEQAFSFEMSVRI